KLDDSMISKAFSLIKEEGKVKIVLLPKKHDEIKIEPSGLLSRSVGEKIKDLEKLRQQVLSRDSRIKAISIRYYEDYVDKWYYSTEDREIHLIYPISGVSITVTAIEAGVTASASTTSFTYKGYIFDIVDENELVNTIINRIDKQLQGRFPKPGIFPVVLDPDVVGVFTHEALGHLAEADLAINGILHKLKGKKIASDEVTVVDSPHMDFPRGIGYTPYDDEGVEGIDVKIIDRGMVKDFLMDRFYAAYLGKMPTGNARAEDFRSQILIRMRNTYMAPGTHRLEELFEGIKEGYFMKSTLGGQTSSDGSFQFGIQEGYFIRNGEIAESLRASGISGFTIETMGEISMVSKDLLISSGFCGKSGQSVPVGTGGPFIRVEKLKVGGYE
ncbi:MAG: TldD/PmbA family protein, partial [Sulfolobus sp.]|nr:TldD/PmbA family protein [Sulfolobus sp.]